MRYKVGDKVYLRDDLENNERYEHIYWNDNMLKNKLVTISKIKEYENLCYLKMKEDNGKYNYSNKMIDHEKTAQLSTDAMDEKQDDMVNHPKHYTQGEIETIDKIKYLTREFSGIEAVCIGNFIKYIDRCNLKGGMEDLEKAKWYLDRFLDEFYDDITW
jgi:hypothetical protein